MKIIFSVLLIIMTVTLSSCTSINYAPGRAYMDASAGSGVSSS